MRKVFLGDCVPDDLVAMGFSQKEASVILSVFRDKRGEPAGQIFSAIQSELSASTPDRDDAARMTKRLAAKQGQLSTTMLTRDEQDQIELDHKSEMTKRAFAGIACLICLAYGVGLVVTHVTDHPVHILWFVLVIVPTIALAVRALRRSSNS